MTRAGKGLFLTFALVAIIVAPPVLGAEIKTMTRVDDPVVVEASDFDVLFGAPMENLALMALRGEAWSPVPFQIDQKKPDGTYAFTDGPAASKDPDPDLDANDDLVFMVKDTGDRAGSGQLPGDAGAIVEIIVTDPKNGNRGWLYLARYPGRAPRSPDDYIRVVIEEDTGYRGVVTYECFMGGPMDRMYPDRVGRVNPDGSLGVDVLDRLKMRGVARFPLGITINFNMDEMVKVEDKAFIDGPVRVLQLAEGGMEVASFVKWKGAGGSVISYYVNHMIWPLTIEVPIPPDLPDFIKAVLPELEVHGYMDFNENVYQSYSFSEANPYNQAVILDGKMSEAEKQLDRETPVEWIGGSGPQGAIFSRLFLPEHIAGQWEKRTFYVDDKTVDDSPEEHPGLTGVGFNLGGPTPMKYKPGGDVFLIYIYFKTDLDPEKASNIIDILDHPVTVEVKPVRGERDRPAPAQPNNPN
jgi:hypothetical protein